MATPPPRPTAAEMRVLEVLWRRGPQTVRAVANALYPDPTAIQYRTVQVQLHRLQHKGLVARDDRQRPLEFAAAVDRGAVIGGELQNVADKVCEGALAPLILNLAGRVTLTAEQKRELRKLLAASPDNDHGEDRSGAARPRGR